MKSCRRFLIVFVFALALPYALFAQPEAVDLGLGVKWASCNLGADSPEACGDYFAWGEVATKQDFSWNTYAWGNGAMTKYNERFIIGRQVDEDDDAARASLGDGWRVPTFAEATELQNECDWVWTSRNGVGGYKIVSRKNGNSIFLPAAGYMEGGKVSYPGSDGRYWTATRHPYHPHCAMDIFFTEKFHYLYFYRRYRGFSIRPVKE